MTWNEIDNKLEKTFLFESFTMAMAFVNKVAALAEAHQHHPEIEINYKKVKLYLQTHDQNNTITEKDRILAKEIDLIY